MHPSASQRTSCRRSVAQRAARGTSESASVAHVWRRRSRRTCGCLTVDEAEQIAAGGHERLVVMREADEQHARFRRRRAAQRYERAQRGELARRRSEEEQLTQCMHCNDGYQDVAASAKPDRKVVPQTHVTRDFGSDSTTDSANGQDASRSSAVCWRNSEATSPECMTAARRRRGLSSRAEKHRAANRQVHLKNRYPRSAYFAVPRRPRASIVNVSAAPPSSEATGADDRRGRAERKPFMGSRGA